MRSAPAPTPASSPAAAVQGRLATGLTLAPLGFAILQIAVLAFGLHPIGDYFTESDFYAGYSIGARVIQHGDFDWGRYAVYGPLYEIALAAVGAIFGDLFLAARVVSVASALVVLVGAAWWMRRRA